MRPTTVGCEKSQCQVDERVYRGTNFIHEEDTGGRCYNDALQNKDL